MENADSPRGARRRWCGARSVRRRTMPRRHAL